MHGRVKVRTSEEQAEVKRKEQKEKLRVYSSVTSKIVAKRKNNELDEELLELTRGILEKNPDFYTFWNYRREILLLLKPQKNLEELKKLSLLELDLTQHCLKVNPKSYSAWHHRLWTMEFTPDADWKRELKLCNYFLSQDERNFHCWDYRRLVVKKCEVSLKEELEYTTKLIESNFSNYSAWHYRSKLLPQVEPAKGSITEDILLKELELIQNAAFTDPDDQSVWFYHRWLLGKKKIPLQILNICVSNAQHLLTVLLSEPVQVSSTNLKLSVNEKLLDVQWRSVNPDMPASTIWLCDLPQDIAVGDSSSKLTVRFEEKNLIDDLSCFINGAKSFKWKNTTKIETFRCSLSAAAKDVLEQELESCQQLNELEPNCKWTMFTCILLMRALNDAKFEKPIEELMAKLIETDTLRKHYYEDLGSKFSIEDAIEKLPVDTTEVNLSNKHLTSLYHFNKFVMIEHINLSSNSITSIYPLHYLIFLKSAVLDDNQLSCLEGIEGLKCLKSLSVKKNYIKDLRVLKKLNSCLNLEELFLEDNPLVTNADYFSTNKNIYTFKVIDNLT